MNIKRTLGSLIAAALAASALPVIPASAATEQLPNRTAAYTLPADAAWTYGEGQTFEVSNMSATNTGTSNRPVWYYFNTTEPNAYSGERCLEVEFTINMTSVNNDSTFSLVGAATASTTDDNPHAVIRLVCDKSKKSLVLEDAKTNTYTLMTSTDNTVSAKIRAVMDFNLKTYDITAYSTADGSELVSYTDMMFYDESMTTVTGVYSRLASGNANVTLSELTIYKQGAAELTRTLYDLSKDIKDTSSSNVTSWMLSSTNSASLTSYYKDGTTDSVSSLYFLNGTESESKSVGGSGARTSTLNFTKSSKNVVNAEFTIDMRFDYDGFNADDYTHYFAVKESADSTNSVLELKAYSNSTNQYTITLNDQTIASYSGMTSASPNKLESALSNNGYSTDNKLRGYWTPKLLISAVMNFSTHTADVTIKNAENTDTTYYTGTVNMLDNTANSVSYAEMHIDRGTIAMYTTLSSFTVTEDGTQEPVITAGTTDVSVGEAVCAARVEAYDVIKADSSDAAVAAVEAVDYLGTVIVTGVKAGEAKITVTATNYNGYENDTNYHKTTTLIIPIKVTAEALAESPAPHAVTQVPLEPPTQIVSIGFDDATADTPYQIRDEYGRMQPTSEINGEQTWTKVTSISNNTDDKYNTIFSPAEGGISGSAFFSRLTPQDGTETGNGYRGSRLILDNEKVQRTDRFRVSYDFAVYNIVNNAGKDGENKKAGTPVAVVMTSETAEAGGIPHQFNTLAYREIDADPSDLSTISRHLLTFMTGRPKRSGDGIHWTDMTNKLAYYSPAHGRYVDTGIALDENAYNYFNVVADVDLYDRALSFTITKSSGTETRNTCTKTIFLPENPSWNGFIISSNKWDTDAYEDVKGQDTEHYAYLDNISAQKTHEDRAHLNPTSMPTEHPLPADAVVFSGGKNHGISKGSTTPDTWVYDRVRNLTEPYTGSEPTYVDYSGEADWNDGKTAEQDTFDFTFNIATNQAAVTGITAYTEFDFYLPKEGSGISVVPWASKSGGNTPGNTISISTAGIHSWRGNNNYELVYGDRLECGKWYGMRLVYDFNGANMEISVTDDAGKSVVDTQVGARTLSGGYYRGIRINPATITTGGDDSIDVSFPAKEPSMATAYIGNLRIYNRATIKEFYPTGTTADVNGNAKAPGTEQADANYTRLGTRLIDFVKDQVGSGVTNPSFIPADNSLAIVPPAVDDKTFCGWKLIYSNGEGANTDTGAEGSGATRLKYAALYEELPVTEIKTSTPKNGYYYKVFQISLSNYDYADNYQKIAWTTYKDNEKLMSGIWNLEDVLPHMTDVSSYTFAHVVYNIPDTVASSGVTAKAQALNESWSDADLNKVSNGEKKTVDEGAVAAGGSEGTADNTEGDTSGTGNV